MKETLTYDLIVVGAGSGGIGAALAAGRLGLRVLLLEKQAFIGGNAAQSGVSVWEMGVGGTGIPFDIYRRLKRRPDAVGIYRFERHRNWQSKRGEYPLHPGAELVIDKRLRYTDSLLRHGSGTGIANESFARKHWHGVPFEPVHYQEVIEEMLAETGNVTVGKASAFVGVKTENGRIASLILHNGREVRGQCYIDGTDNGSLCRELGCRMLFGQESRAVFNEPDAPETASARINGVSLIYRIGLGALAGETPDRALPADCWWAGSFPPASMVEYPNGDFNVNMLPTMEGDEFMGYRSYAAAYEECRKRVLAHFEWMKREYPPYAGYRMVGMAPALGVREGRRVVTEYVLTQHDLLAGLSRQLHPDGIALADHPMDTHGNSTGRAGCRELEEPYSIPYRCLLPKGYPNVLIASRAAGFSSLAASSCRLSRTMMQLGQAAGTAAWLSVTENVPLPQVAPGKLRNALRKQHVQLEYPMTAALKEHLENE